MEDPRGGTASIHEEFCCSRSLLPVFTEVIFCCICQKIHLPPEKTPEELGEISCSTNSVKTRKDQFSTSPPVLLRNLLSLFLLQNPLQFLPRLSGCFCSRLSHCVALKSQCFSFLGRLQIVPFYPWRLRALIRKEALSWISDCPKQAVPIAVYTQTPLMGGFII